MAIDSLTRSPVYLLLECSRLIRRHFTEQLADTCLTEPQWRVLAFISRSEGLSQTELALLLGMHKVALGEQIERLRQLGYIERVSDPQDRRTRRIYMAAAARPVSDTMHARFSAFAAQLQQQMAAELPGLQHQLRQLSHQLCPPRTLRALQRLTLDNSMHLLGVLARLLGKRIDTILKPHALTRLQWLVLTSIYQRPACSQTELSLALGVNKAALGQLLDSLQARTWLQREADDDDKRINRLSLSQSATAEFEQISVACAGIDASIHAALDAEAIAALVAALSRLRQQLIPIPVTANL
jgi:DNA-binding MarR family transcriptional regulator